MPRDERSRELARKRHRRAKLKKLRAQYAKATDRAQRETIQEKVRKISPFAVLEESK